jgi:hypothetical protein
MEGRPLISPTTYTTNPLLPVHLTTPQSTQPANHPPDIRKETTVSANPTTQQPTSLGVNSPTSPTTSIPLSPVISPDRRGDDRRGSDEWGTFCPHPLDQRPPSVYLSPPTIPQQRQTHTHTHTHTHTEREREREIPGRHLTNAPPPKNRCIQSPPQPLPEAQGLHLRRPQLTRQPRRPQLYRKVRPEAYRAGLRPEVMA